MSYHEKQHSLDNEREQNISESFWFFSVSGTGGKAIRGREIKEIQVLGVDYTRQKWDILYKQAFPQSHIYCICPRNP